MGTLLLTGANSSLGLPAVEYLLANYPTHTAIPHSPEFSICRLNLASFPEVISFAGKLNEEIANGDRPRLCAIVCNAMTWFLSDGAKYSTDGLELSMAVNHLAHLSLVLRLLQSMDGQTGRIVFLSSESHWPGKAGFEVYPPTTPRDLDEWVHPKEDGKGEGAGRGFYRYGVSKLAVIMGMYALGRRLKKTKGFENIRALAIDPGGLLDSRAFAQADVPASWKVMIGVANWLQPLLHFLNPGMNRSESAARDVVDLAVSEEMKGKEGHFMRRAETESSPDSRVEGEQERVWGWSLGLIGVGKEDTVLDL
ncbi:short-chain dehydrogenase/reductase-like protein sdr [Lentithecium fluviatile CBS 122367]|uniref:3beta-hydroxysteroid 3-dehydrogenase n=1 Tax=Lentithecium fluviatile CBS 122367 TaxID=1168545 RepID=A0A6G1J712_9PLEO|nr:short-chain dehydrogenase/reductase-like protein sdr [Lentithecium fluviatile CBS 122367]